MMFTNRRLFLFMIVLLLGSAGVSWSEEFPTGSLNGISILVEKGSWKFSAKDLHKFRLVAEVVKLSNDEISITTSSTLQLSPRSPEKKDKRFDTYKVVWESKNSGNLINTNSRFKGDNSSFWIVNNRLTIKSWIHRNQLWETHTYSFKRQLNR